MKTHETILRTRYGETDQMGVIYHPNYYIYFEIGRTEFLRDVAGISYKEIEGLEIMLPVTETYCKYINPAKYDDELLVRTSVKEMTVARIAFTYQLLRSADGVTLAEGETVHAFTDKQGKPVNLRKTNKALYEMLESLAEIHQ